MEKCQSLVDPISFFQELGDLHDVKVCRIEWNVCEQAIVLEVEDLNANFIGLPDYQGKKQALIKFNAVENLRLDCDAEKADVQRIYELEVIESNIVNKREIALRIAPSGFLNFFCYSIEISEIS
jgi:hypothetical protein